MKIFALSEILVELRHGYERLRNLSVMLQDLDANHMLTNLMRCVFRNCSYRIRGVFPNDIVATVVSKSMVAAMSMEMHPRFYSHNHTHTWESHLTMWKLGDFFNATFDVNLIFLTSIVIAIAYLLYRANSNNVTL